jgi:prepilin signal peptidase PulO-like enzyme (type II secretory pathway)
MNEIILGTIAAVIGAALGSFAGAQVWRLRARQLVEEKQAGEKVDAKEYKRLLPLTKQSLLTDRSIDLDTGEQLKWYDMIPVISWLMLRGKSRYSGKPIGLTELLLEVGMAVVFTLSVLFWPAPLDQPLEIVKLLLWLAALVPLAINFVYDIRWMALISYCNWLIIVLGLVYAGVTVFQAGDWAVAALSVVSSVLILGGLYGLLWLVSRGKWVGDGDIYLGAGLGLFLADWRAALVGLFLANLIGTLIVLPGLVTGKLARKSQVPFGPLLIAGCVLAWFVGVPIVEWYQSLLLIP